MGDYSEYDDHGEEERPRDAAIDRAVARVRAFFEDAPKRLFYSTQIETTLEREFFHWITGKALLELANDRSVQRVVVPIHGSNVNFYAHLGHRYWRREQTQMVALLDRVFHPDFARAIGRHGELMFDAALGRSGFRADASNTRSWNGVTWEATNHNLDRIIIRDGLAYGVEIKNTQNYISHRELRIKLQICEHLSVTPLFIVRFAPKSYIHEVNQRGGFVLLFEDQFYPMGHTSLLADVRKTLGLKVHSPIDVKDGDIQRFVRWHQRRSGNA